MMWELLTLSVCLQSCLAMTLWARHLASRRRSLENSGPELCVASLPRSGRSSPCIDGCSDNGEPGRPACAPVEDPQPVSSGKIGVVDACDNFRFVSLSAGRN